MHRRLVEFFAAFVLVFTAASPLAAKQATPAPIEVNQREIAPERVVNLLLPAPFPTEDLPVQVGEPVVLIMDSSSDRQSDRTVGTMLVRNATLEYPYPFVFYRVYANRNAADRYIRATVDLPDDSAVPADVDQPLTTETSLDTTQALIRIGSVVVVGNAATGTFQERQQAATAFARVGAAHLQHELLLAETNDDKATPDPANSNRFTVSPLKFYERLAAANYPQDLAPDGFPPLTVYRWQDSNDADLAGAIGGVIVATGDPFRSDPANALTYWVYPDQTTAETTFSRFEQQLTELGVPFTSDEFQRLPSMSGTFGDRAITFVRRDNVILAATIVADGDGPSVTVDQIEPFTEGGLKHLERLVGDAISTPIP